MSMYRDYVENQVPNRFVYEDEDGFLTYTILEGNCVLEEIYVIPEARRKGIASKYYKMMEHIGKDNNCHQLIGTIIVGTNGAEASMKCLLKNGFMFNNVKEKVIYLKKKIGE